MRIFLLLTTLFAFAGTTAFAQGYTTATGIRFGSDFGITLQQRLWKNYTLEAMVQQGLRSSRTSVTALVQQHHPVLGRGINLYLGAGPQVAFTQAEIDKYQTSSAAWGLSLIGGLEGRIGRTLLSFDYKPAFYLTGQGPFYEGQSAVSARYVLLKRQKKEKKKDWKFWQKDK